MLHIWRKMLWKRQDEEAAVSGLVWSPSVSDLLFSQQYPCEFFREEYEEKWQEGCTGGTNALGTRCEGSSPFKMEWMKKCDAES